jgi:hypothetical protein
MDFPQSSSAAIKAQDAAESALFDNRIAVYEIPLKSVTQVSYVDGK